MWIYRGKEMGLEGLIGVPATDLTDEEFVEYSAKIDRQFVEQGSMERCGLWERQSDAPPVSSRINRVTTPEPEPVIESKES